MIYYIGLDVGSNLGVEYFMVDEIIGNISFWWCLMFDKVKMIKYVVKFLLLYFIGF